jgi:acyl-CoA thioester hydrolase
MVAFDLEKNESKELEEEWKDAICQFEGRDLRKK